MESLDSGISPSINTRVTPNRKKQIKALANMHNCSPSDVVRAAIDDYIAAQPAHVLKELIRLIRA